MPADFNPDLVRHLPNRAGVPAGCFRRKIVFKLIVELDSVKTRPFGQLETLSQVHPLRIGEGPLIDRFLQSITRCRALPGIDGGGCLSPDLGGAKGAAAALSRRP